MLIVPSLKKLSRDERIELVRRMHAGDGDAADDLIRSIAPWINKIIKKLQDTNRFIDPDEISSEVWFQVTKSLAKYNPEQAALTTYVTRACYYGIYQVRKRHFRQIPCERLGYEATTKDTCESREKDVDDTEGYGEDLAELAVVVAKLPPRHADILNRRMKGEKLLAIGEAHGISKERTRKIVLQAIEYARIYWKRQPPVG